MSEPETTMDGAENPEREPGRRIDLSALAWRRSPPAPAPTSEGNGSAEQAEGAAVEDSWSPPEPWSPPEWTPPDVSASAPAAVAAEAPSPWAPPAAASEIVDADVIDEEPRTDERPFVPPVIDVPTSEYQVVPRSTAASAGPPTVDETPPPSPVQDVAPAAWPASVATEPAAEPAFIPAVAPEPAPAPAFIPAAAPEPVAPEPAPAPVAMPAWTPEPAAMPTPVVAETRPLPAPEPVAMAEPATWPASLATEAEPVVQTVHTGPSAEAEPRTVRVEEPPPIDAILPRAEGYREVGYDTVLRAANTGHEFQPYLELGLQPDEYARIRQILGRRPTESELAMYAVMWSEHCSYKSSKVHLREFGKIAERMAEQGGENESGRMLAGIGANAGVVKVSDRLAVTFKVESHNHPSFVEPHQGAATGVGGIVRDILAMGARPVAVMDPLRFGAPEHEDTRRVLPGVIAGIGGYGNCLGLPNIGGEVVFDECYQGNPLVNALCVGVLPIDKLQQKAATGPGNIVVLMGAKTGRDGIGGVSVLASSTFGQGSESRRPSVQVGDPFLEKLLIEACLEIYDLELVAGIQDLGGAGLTCALSEMSAAAELGMAVNLDLVPLREASMRAEEVLVSESQERMLLVVTPENLPVVLSICARWGVLATAIGEVTAPDPESGARLRIWWRGEVVVDVPPGSLADDGPVYARPMREPYDRELMKADRPETLPRPETPAALRETVLRMIASPNLCDKSWVTEQYDRYVLGNTVLAQPEDSGVVRIEESTGLGVAIATDGNGRYARLDPYAGAKLALAEAYRNVAVTGATPVAVTNCLNFGSPEDPGVMWQFAEAVRGLADGCVELGIPVTGGNVSFYNQTGGNAINPTPVVGVLGLHENVARRVPMGFSGEGDPIFLLGTTREEIGGSEWCHVVHQHLGGEPPAVDLAAEQRLGRLLAEAASLGYLTAAHDLSEGGLAQGLVESCLRRNMGAHVALPPDGQSAFVHLFSESTARAIVSVRKGHEQAFAALADERGVPRTALGIVTAIGTPLVFDELFEVDLDELRRAHTATLPTLFN
jgi:phosphoribosylformylglycinamidine synthase subunit PurL